MAKYNRDTPLPSSDPMFETGSEKKKKAGKKKKKAVWRPGRMPVSEAKARIAQYEKQTGQKWVPTPNAGALKD